MCHNRDVFCIICDVFGNKRTKVALRISPSPLPNHPIEPAEDDVDVGGEELAFVIELVAHNVSVDGHPGESSKSVICH